MCVGCDGFEGVRVSVEAIDRSDYCDYSRLLFNRERNTLGVRMKQVEDYLVNGNSVYQFMLLAHSSNFYLFPIRSSDLANGAANRRIGADPKLVRSAHKLDL